MNILQTDINGVLKYFPALNKNANWWPLIRNDNAMFFIGILNDTPQGFVSVVEKENKVKIDSLYVDKQVKSSTAVFELQDFINNKYKNVPLEAYVINETALWGWQRMGMEVYKSKKYKNWNAYWIRRDALTD